MKGKIITSVAIAAAVTLSGCTAGGGQSENSEEIIQTQLSEAEAEAQTVTGAEEGQEDAEELTVSGAEEGQEEAEEQTVTGAEEGQEDAEELTVSGAEEGQEQAEEQMETGAEEGQEDAEELTVSGAEEGQEQAEEQMETGAEDGETSASYASYIKVTGAGVNIRSGAGTSYASLGAAEQNTLYANLGLSGGWYKTLYQNKTAYISAAYCEVVEIEASQSEQVESVIAEGLKLLGVEYVYGAVRYHDGVGKLYSGFTITEFDCSSLMQYIFYKGAGALLQVNTRTQIYQGEHVEKSDLQRGDLMFFTNDSRYNNTGIERVGHVALYLGDNYILHTSSDYAKIEQLTTKRWNYFLEARRMV